MNLIGLTRFWCSREVGTVRPRGGSSGLLPEQQNEATPWIRGTEGGLGMMFSVGPSAGGELGLEVDVRVETTDP